MTVCWPGLNVHGGGALAGGGGLGPGNDFDGRGKGRVEDGLVKMGKPVAPVFGAGDAKGPTVLLGGAGDGGEPVGGLWKDGTGETVVSGNPGLCRVSALSKDEAGEGLNVEPFAGPSTVFELFNDGGCESDGRPDSAIFVVDRLEARLCPIALLSLIPLV